MFTTLAIEEGETVESYVEVCDACYQPNSHLNLDQRLRISMLRSPGVDSPYNVRTNMSVRRGII